MRKDTRRFVALAMVLCMLACLVPTVGTRAEESASYTSEVDVTLYVGQFATYEQTAVSTQQETEINSDIASADVETVTTVYDAQLGTDSSYDGDYTNLENALYTFTYATATPSDAIYTICNEATGIYLNLSSARLPGKTKSDTIQISAGSSEREFYLYSTSQNRYLYFYRDGKNYFDRTDKTVEAASAFLIYRPITTGETGSTELPGYIQVTSLDDIFSGGQYLIAVLYNNTYYVLYPSTSTGTDYYAHVAKVLDTSVTETDYTVTFTGVAEGTTSMVVGDVKYNITVLETAATGTDTLEGGEATTLSISALDSGFSLAEGSTVVWSVADTDIASLYNTDGASTKLVAHAEGKTNVIAKVYDASGNETAVYVWTITVNSTYGSGDYTYTWKITEKVYNGTLYYSVDGEELIEAEPDSVTTDDNGNTIRTYTISYVSENESATGLIYFIKPDEGYAVTYVYDTGGNTQSNFFAVSTLNGYYTKKDYTTEYSDFNGGWPTDIMSNAEWDALLDQAIAAGCDVAYWNTRTGSSANGSYTGSYTNYCDKLPTVDKVITSLTRTVEGAETSIKYVDSETKVEVGDVIHYTVSITTYYETVDIEYSNVLLTDSLSSGSNGTANFTVTGSTTLDATQDLDDDGAVQTATDAVVATYEVTYTVVEADQDSELLNTVSLSYNYSSEYSTGSYGGTASAVATVNLSTFDPDDIVIDFGLPVTIDYSEATGLSFTGNSAIASGTATYGKITVTDGNKVTYTPTSVLTEVDTVTLYSVGGAYTTFKVYPATTVYYEEGFADYGTGWSVDGATSNGWSTNSNKGTTKQEAQAAGDKSSAISSATGTSDYNYDSAYADDTGASDGTAASTVTVADSLSFTFTGTGVDIFANCDENSGRVAIRIAESDSGTIKKFLFVDMANTGTYSTGTIAYNTPIASVSDLTYGSYTVTIYLITASTSGFRFDGFRVYDTIAQEKDDTTSDAYTIQTTVYEADDEDYPVYYELRDYVLAGLDIATSSDSVYASDIAASTTAQVYSTDTSNTTGAVVYYDASDTNSSVLVSGTTAQTLLDDGPKNELYLYPGMTVVFKITTDRKVEIGLRSVTGGSDGVTYSITASTSKSGVSCSTVNNGTISSTVDMFYTLQTGGDGTEVTYTISVPNSSSGILSITDIKVCDCPDDTIIGELTEEDLTAALVSIGYAADEEPVTYAEATLTMELTDYTGTVLATAALTENGVEGESAVFAASDILEAVNVVLPNGYALVSTDSVTEQAVVYGEDGSLNVQIGKVATLTVTYQKYTGLFRKTTVATVTLTKVQTDRSSRATFSVSEIRATVPAGYRVLLVTSASVNYGMNGSKTIICY